ncbi:MAG: DUF5652 family protein [Candidatus Woesebacteria bacterium]|jgi:hypothetical protein
MNLQSIYNNYRDVFIILLAIWSLFWKGIGLWRSSKNDQKYWFVSILIVNTAGLLEIIYLAFFQRKGQKAKKGKVKKSK